MNRRGFITGLVSLVAAPAIVRAGSLMPVKLVEWDLPLYGISPAMKVLQDIEEIRRRIRYEYLERLINPPVIFKQDGQVWFRGIPIRVVDKLDG